ncbi:MAG: hypothetical protein HY775_10840 [Acidobacteria bacterium]|nr:hypothetical protein [Acidobacteriota bacterium]
MTGGLRLSVAVLLMLTACRVSGIALVQDDRVTIVAPEDHGTVTLPFDISWRTRDLDEGTTFALFLDRTPIAPGTTLVALFDDAVCARDPSCPSDDALLGFGVRRTVQTSLLIETLPPTDRPSAPDMHVATLILLNASGSRIGESAFSVTFKVAHND